MKKDLAVQRGTCILKEKPFVHVLKSEFRKKRCDFCFKIGKLLKCSGCNYLYYCNKSCQKDDWALHKSECPSLKKIGSKTIPDAARVLCRIILKLKNGGDLEKSYYTDTCYRKFKDMMSHYAELKNDCKRIEHLESLYVVLCSLLDNCLIPNKTELLGIFGRLTTNGFNILDPEMNSIGVGIYLGVSVIDHSCHANAVVTFEDTTLCVRVTEDISCLDWSKIFISYIDLLDTPEHRRNDLKENYYFLCECSKCIDPQETIEMTAAACLNKDCDEYLDIEKDKCPKCNTDITEEHKLQYNQVLEFTKKHLENMKNIAYLDICKVCLEKQQGIFHPLNVWHIKTLDLAFDSAINVNKWTEALTYSDDLILGFRKYCGEWNPLLGLLYMKIGKIQLYEGNIKDAYKNLNEARKIIGVTHGSNHSFYQQQLIPSLYQATMENS